MEKEKITAVELKKALLLHKAWLQGKLPIGKRADFSYENFSALDLSKVDFSKAILSHIDLFMADLHSAILYQADLEEAKLICANLSGASLQEANVRGANLRYADLSGANLLGADLSGADLRGADLRGAKLREANLSGAYLWGARLDKADLRGAKLDRTGVTREALYKAFIRREELDRASIREEEVDVDGVYDINLDPEAEKPLVTKEMLDQDFPDSIRDYLEKRLAATEKYWQEDMPCRAYLEAAAGLRAYEQKNESHVSWGEILLGTQLYGKMSILARQYPGSSYNPKVCAEKAVYLYQCLYDGTLDDQYKELRNEILTEQLEPTPPKSEEKEISGYQEYCQTASYYDILVNDKEQVLFVIPNNLRLRGDTDAAVAYYDGEEHLLLFRNAQNLMLFDYLNINVREIVLDAKELFFTKIKSQGEMEEELLVELIYTKDMKHLTDAVFTETKKDS